MLKIKLIDCPECSGEGEATYERVVAQGFNNPFPEYEDYKTECENCYGVGQIEPLEEDE